jgi:methylthioribose-1-phosphate isomerase
MAVRGHAAAGDWRSRVAAEIAGLAEARPTAVNLGWALARMEALLERHAPQEDFEAEAAAVQTDDLVANQRLSELGAALLPEGATVLTHCNTGALATGGHGTALGVIRTAWARGRIRAVVATETRPWLQGARLTAWELSREGIPATLIVDSAAAAMMSQGAIQAVVVGADRITTAGDVANKIGTYALALAAHAHGLPFIVAAPHSTVDARIRSGDAVPIETRDAGEIWRAAGLEQPLAGIDTWNPVFDITPARLVTAVVTERGVAWPAEGRGLAMLAA